MCWDLQTAPTPPILMGIFARVQFLPAHYLIIWEEAFYTGFFEYQSNIFGPLVQDMWPIKQWKCKIRLKTFWKVEKNSNAWRDGKKD